MHFIASQGDRLMLGRLMGATTLGVYSIAVYVSETVGSLTIRIVHGVFYPVFSRVVREDRASLARIYYKTRLRLDLLAMPALGGLSVLGPWVIDLLWDDRYRGAGWMLQLLTARVALSVWATPCQTCLVALGQPRHAFARTVARMVSVLIGVPTGYALGGVEGLVLAVALSEVPGLFVLLPPFAREGLLRPTRELIAPLMFGLGAGVAALLDPWLPRW